MSIEGAMSTALNGMNAFSYQVGNISDNLANTSTVGYKRVDSRFKDLISGPTVSFNDPVSVRETPIYRADLSGTVVSSDNLTSFAVTNGEGFVPTVDMSLESGKPVVGKAVHYTRAADFTVDANTYLVNSGGQALMAVQENPPFSGQFPTKPTAADLTAVEAVLPIYKTIPGVPSATINVNVNFPANAATDLDPAAGGPAPGQSPADQELSLKVYDSQGTSHDLQLMFRKTAPDTWEAVGATVNDVPPVTVPLNAPYQTVSFDQTGRLTAATQLTFSASGLSGGGSLNGLVIDFGTPTSSTTQFSAANMEIRDIQDPTGHTPGNFATASIDPQGVVTFKYTNGVQISPYKIPLATFTNPNLLDRLTGATFGDNPELAGTAVYSWPGSGKEGNIVPNSVEQSNVDIATELVKMITAQRAYSSNAKIISTSDSMTETAITLKT